MVKLQVIGHLGKDAVVNNVGGKNVINFSVAHSEKFKDAQGVQKEKTTWVECAYWTDRTGVSQYLKKGTQVYADGAPDIRNYTTKDGAQGTSLVLRVATVQLLGGGGGNSGGGDRYAPVNEATARYYAPAQQEMSAAQPAGNITEPSDDLPF